ncbi:MAG TPA: hypothetical protein VN666_06775 [Nitrospira sp.]|nr:hypothetical protein [Nitrospira sp.]
MMSRKEYWTFLAVAAVAGLLGGAASVHLLGAHSAIADDSSKRPLVINAEAFQVVDKEGKPLAHLGKGASKNKISVMLGYEESKARAVLGTLPDGSAALAIIGPDGQSTSLSWDAGGVMGLMFFDKRNTRRMALTTGTEGSPSLTFYDNVGKVVWKAP